MKIVDVIHEYMGDVGPETMIMHRTPTKKRGIEQIPQVGYKMRIGKKVIPNPGYNSDNDQGQLNQVIGG